MVSRVGFRIRDKVRVGVRINVGVRVSASYFLSHSQPTDARSCAVTAHHTWLKSEVISKSIKKTT